MFYNCINLIKLSINKKKKGFIINKNSNNMQILKAFLKINVIKFIIIKNQKIIVYINYYNNKPVFKNIVNIFKPGYKKYISYKNLNKIMGEKKLIIILSTNKGVLNNFEAVNLKIGGLILANIWN